LRPGSGASVRPLLLTLFILLAAPCPARAQDEFLLNDDRVDRNQWAPRAALGGNGTILVAWMDGRNGTPSFIDYDTYLMSIRDPLGLGTSLNRRANDDASGATQGFPDIAGSPSGTFLCVWEDGRAGNRDIYEAAFDSTGVSIAPNLRVNDDGGNADQSLPRVIPYGADKFLVLWGDGREGQGEIYAAFRTATGAPLGGNRRISVDPVLGGSFQGEPGAGVGADGRTLVVWLDGREAGTFFGTVDVYAQWLDAAGDALGGNFKVNATTGAGQCASPAVAADPGGQGFVVAWIDRRTPGDTGDVYAQRYDASGAPVGPNVRVNDDPVGRDQRHVRAAAGSGVAALVWEDYRGNFGIDANVEGAFVPYGVGSPGANFRVNQEVGGRQGTPSVIWDGRDAYLCVWEDGRRGTPDVFAISFLPSGARRGADTQLNDDAAPFDQRGVRLGHGPGRYVATWTDRRSQTNDLFGQWITAAGARDGVNHLLWKDDFVERPVSAASAVSGAGRALVAAQITRFSDAGDIRGFFYAVAGLPPSSSFWISDVLPSAQAAPAAAATDSEFAVVWLDARDGAPRVYGQRLSPVGSRIGGNHPVLAVDPTGPITALDVAPDSAGGYWLCYAEGSEADQRLWLVPLDADLAPLAAPVPVSPGLPGGREEPSVGSPGPGRADVSWLGIGSNGYGRVYHQSFGSDFTTFGAVAIESQGGQPAAAPSLAVSRTGSILSWAELGPLGDWNIWMQRFAGAAPAAPPVRVDEDLSGADQFAPCAGFDDAGHGLVVWTDLRSTASGSDILGRAFEFSPTYAEEPPPLPEPGPPPSPPPAPRATHIGPARPNPFSSETAAPVTIAGSGQGRARAVVWNARGERVATLVDGAAPGERFTLRWDGKDDRGRPAASGVYWITIESGGERHATRVVHLR